MKLNDKDYWNNRFETDWESAHGPEQSLLHYTILIDKLPEWLKKKIQKNNYSICDMGCGMGEGTQKLHESFPNSEVIGVDHAPAAIEKATKNYNGKNISFLCEDIFKIKRNFDIIITSHTLEHFHEPFNIVNKLADKCKCLIITVPFREDPLWEEHVFSFDYDSFPINFNNQKLLYYKEVEPTFFEAGNYFLKEQIMVIYGNKDYFKDISLFELNNSNYDEKCYINRKFDDEINSKNQLIADLNEELKLKNNEINLLNQKIDQFKDRKSVKFADKLNKIVDKRD